MSNLPSPASDGGDSLDMATTPIPFNQLRRTVSHGSQWSITDLPHHHNHGTSHFPSSASPAPRQTPAPILVRNTSVNSTRRGPSTSVSSSHVTARGFRDDDALSEEDEDTDEGNEHLVDTRGKATVVSRDDEDAEDDVSSERAEEDPITLKDRQSLINVEHPFGLPIWKPALYKKSRSVTRYADEALHSIPSAQAERHLLPGNIFWVLFFGWWLSVTCFTISGLLYLLPHGGPRYATLVYGLGWYLAWPFGKYVEGDVSNFIEDDEENPQESGSSGASDSHTVRGESPQNPEDSAGTIRGVPLSEHSTITPRNVPAQHLQTESWNSASLPSETTSLLINNSFPRAPSKSYGVAPTFVSAPFSGSFGVSKQNAESDWLGKLCFWLAFISIIAPLMLLVCITCWALVITIPMAKLNWALIKHIFERPTTIRFCAAPPAVVVPSAQIQPNSTDAPPDGSLPPQFSVKHPRLAAGQAAPSGSPTSTVLLCTYRAVGLQYYKYTIGGVNILFVNLLPIVFFVIFDGFVLLPMIERLEDDGKHVPTLLAIIGSQALIFFLSLLSVIPLSYFIGMAVASISAQSSIGMGAVINATFGSIIEIILYAIALTQSKGHLVEGSIVGSLLAGVLLMPGMSMCSSALRRKEQKFNAKSAGVTSMMLIMAIIGTLAPTLFYQTYGNFQLVCSGCPSTPSGGESNAPWICDHCYYQHPDPVNDPFYQSTVKSLMYFCAAILVFSYLIGLWFSLRTHASQIWQNPQQLLHPMELPVHNRLSLYQKLVPSAHTANNQRSSASLRRKPSTVGGSNLPSRAQTPLPRDHSQPSTSAGNVTRTNRPSSPSLPRRVSYANVPQNPGFSPVLESVDHVVKDAGLHTMNLPENMTTDDFTRAVAVATVSALRHQQTHAQSPARIRGSGGESEAGGGHAAPSWSRTTSASVLLACTALYALIAEILVDVVDVILQGSGIDEKFLGVTLFALVPNTTEFMNAMSFALNGNIALSMEIGSAYALQVCLLQIPAMVAFSAWYAPDKMGEVANTFTLIFPRWDVVVIILSMFLMTYTYIEAKSNYHRGSILILSYLVLTAGFYFAPHTDVDIDLKNSTSLQKISSLTLLQSVRWCFASSWWSSY